MARIDEDTAFDETEIRAAERRLTAALEAPDRTAWVSEYTEDAVFDGRKEPDGEWRVAIEHLG
jgi:ketosteroid isomerase-like protein